MTEGRIALKILDLDGDGEREAVLCNDHLYAVVSPARGGRLTYLLARTPGASGGVLVIGNPTDDWNLQEELNRHMTRPANHPGALSDVGFEHDRYEISATKSDGCASLEMTNVEEGSGISGARKRLLLAPGAAELSVSYELPEGTGGLDVEACLSPDYHHLLREGREALVPYDGEDRTRRGFRSEEVAVWVGLDTDGRTSFVEPAVEEVGHGRIVRVRACKDGFRFVIGCGEANEARKDDRA